MLDDAAAHGTSLHARDYAAVASGAVETAVVAVLELD